MKNLLKTMLLTLVCAFASLILFGCAPLFDALNFNREPLPNTPSLVDDELKNPYERDGSSFLSEDFSALINASTKERTNYQDDLIISLHGANNPMYVEHSISRKFRTIDKTLVTDSDPNDSINYPYAEYQIETTNFSRVNGDTYYFYDDSFNTGIIEGNEWSWQKHFDDILYSLDEYVDLIGHEPFVEARQTVAGDGFFYTLLRLLEENFNNAVVDYTNGKKMIHIELDEDIHSTLLGFIPSDFIIPSWYGKLVKMRPLEIEYEKDIIEQIALTLEFEDGIIIYDFSTIAYDYQLIYNGLLTKAMPSYCYGATRSSSFFGVVVGEYYNDERKPSEYHANIVFDNYEKFNHFGVSGEIDFYQEANPLFTGGWQYGRDIKVIDYGDEKAYTSKDQISVYQNNSYNIQEGTSYTNYYIDFISITDFLKGKMRFFKITEMQYSIVENENGYTITGVYTFAGEGDAEGDYRYEVTFKTNSDLTKIYSFEEAEYQGNVRNFMLKIELSYDFVSVIPNDYLAFVKNQ